MADRKTYFRHPQVMADLAGLFLADAASLAGREKAAATRNGNRCVKEGILAAMVLALDLTADYPVNPAPKF